MGVKQQQAEKWFAQNLTPLVAVIFLFYGGLGCLYSTLVPHALQLGFYESEIRTILTIVALISIIGPLTFGPLADRIADRKKSVSGRYLRLTLATLLILGAIAYGLLLLVPEVRRSPARQPLVSFGCDSDGAIIFQERCSEEKTCYHWKKEKTGVLKLTNCSYTCQKPTQFENLYVPWTEGSPQPPTETSREREEYDYPDNSSADFEASANERVRREVQSVLVEPPHLCTKNAKTNEVDRCHVYTHDLKILKIEATLHSATNQENDTHSADWCYYPLDGFQCNIPPQQATYMKKYMNNSNCKPMIECEVSDPYENPSVLAESQCFKIVGDIEYTYWSYILIRSIADIFPVAIITLLNAAVIIATRETSTCRADIGRKLAWGALGWALTTLILGFWNVNGFILVPVVWCIIMWFIAAIILIVSTNMPLSPPEWWWHTKIGMLAIPLSAIRKYGPEIVALTIVAIVLGAFWSIIDTYLPIHLITYFEEAGHSIFKFGLTVAAIPAFFLLWKVEFICDYCGHSNVLIVAFAVYIFRFIGLSEIQNSWYIILTAIIESITLPLAFITLVLSMRHLWPRRLTATAQAIPVIAFLCLGKAIGIVVVSLDNNPRELFGRCAIAAAIVGSVYFILYHCYLAKRCAAKSQPPPSPAILQSHANGTNNGTQNGAGAGASNSNGSYTPLRVYHDSRGRKGHFRY